MQTPPVRQVAVTVEPSAQGVSEARRIVDSTAPLLRCDVDWTGVSVAVAELAANAAAVNAGEVTVSVRRYGDRLRVEVRDHGLGLPVEPEETADDPSAIDALTETGRGLRLVAGFADDWGVEQFLPGKIVWAEFGHRGGPAAR